MCARCIVCTAARLLEHTRLCRRLTRRGASWRCAARGVRPARPPPSARAPRRRASAAAARRWRSTELQRAARCRAAAGARLAEAVPAADAARRELALRGARRTARAAAAQRSGASATRLSGLSATTASFSAQPAMRHRRGRISACQYSKIPCVHETIWCIRPVGPMMRMTQ